MEVKLKVLQGKHAGKIIKVSGSEFIIGRGADCHLRAGSDMISRHHCKLVISKKNAVLVDCGSRNGTYVNGTLIQDETSLASGDKISIGPLEFKVITEFAVGGGKRPEVKDLADVAKRSAKPQRSVEDDISDWLNEPGNVSSRDTQPITAAAEETSTDLSVKIPDEKGKDENDDKQAGTETVEIPEPGKLPKIKVDAAENSQDAAVKFLQKMKRSSRM